MYPNNSAHVRFINRELAEELKREPIMIEFSASAPPQDTADEREALLRADCEGKPCFSSCPRRQQKSSE